MIKAELFGNDSRIQKLITFAQNVSVTKAPVLIVGESGTGKKTLGQYIHENSSRTESPVLIVDCSEDSAKVESEILGSRDAGTGRFNKGVLERGNGGTVIFANFDGLDEEFQKRIHKIFLELEDYEIDVRIVATTTKNLSKLVGSGRFYRGLYTYVSGTQITLPPLRERVQDIEYLANFFLTEAAMQKEFDSEYGMPKFSPEAKEKLISHYWTYNVKELRSVIENSIDECKEGVIKIDDLAIGERKSLNFSSDDDDDGLKLMSLKEAERMLIKKALIHTSENRTQAAKILGVSIRTLRNKINEYRNTGQSYFVNLR